jgi:hypothetical protein
MIRHRLFNLTHAVRYLFVWQLQFARYSSLLSLRVRMAMTVCQMMHTLHASCYFSLTLEQLKKARSPA